MFWVLEVLVGWCWLHSSSSPFAMRSSYSKWMCAVNMHSEANGMEWWQNNDVISQLAISETAKVENVTLWILNVVNCKLIFIWRITIINTYVTYGVINVNWTLNQRKTWQLSWNVNPCLWALCVRCKEIQAFERFSVAVPMTTMKNMELIYCR